MSRDLIRLPLICLCAIMLCLSGCRSSRSATDSLSGKPDSTPANVDQAVMRLRDSYKPWQTLRIPFTLKISQPQNLTIGGTATMQRGEMLRLSMRMLGFEVIAIDLTPDTATILDRVNRRYAKVPLQQLTSQLPVNLTNLQDLLLGRPFLPGEDGLGPHADRQLRLGVNNASNTFSLTPRTEPWPGFSYIITANNDGSVASLLLMSDAANSPKTEYGAEQQGICANRCSLSATLGKSPLAAEIKWDTDKMRVDDPSTAIEPLRINSGYQPIDLKSLKLP